MLRGEGSIVLDAGCGNGYLALAAARSGASVVAVSNDYEQIERNRDYFRFLQVKTVRFEVIDLYNIDRLDQQFDQIFCIEVLEHLRRDADVVASFRRLTYDNGELIICSPNASHPEHALGRVDEPEDGWHVRDGYTAATYQQLVDLHGFSVREFFGVGGRATAAADRVLRSIRAHVGEGLSIPAFAVLAPLAFLDRGQPKTPYSLGAVCDPI